VGYLSGFSGAGLDFAQRDDEAGCALDPRATVAITSLCSTWNIPGLLDP
jgi:hypothetical protein